MHGSDRTAGERLNPGEMWKGNDTYRYVREHPGCTVSEITDSIGETDSYRWVLLRKKVTQQLLTLKKSGKVATELGDDHRSHWWVVE